MSCRGRTSTNLSIGMRDGTPGVSPAVFCDGLRLHATGFQIERQPCLTIHRESKDGSCDRSVAQPFLKCAPSHVSNTQLVRQRKKTPRTGRLPTA